MSRLSRRELALAFLSLSISARPALSQAPTDQGIGGTGAAPGDRGIGGTGVIGTIRRFGSIYVNGLRIAYAPSVEVLIDGRRASAAQMKIGHVVQAVASGAGDGLRTQRIEIVSEVVGPVERFVPDGMVVLGQVVDLRGARPRNALKPGAFVAVFGQRRPNGVIVASLVEPRAPGATRIAGPISVDSSGRPSIGGLALRGVPAGLADARVSLEGTLQGDAYSVSRFRSLARPFGPNVSRVSIEGYLGAGGRLGSGVEVGDARGGSGLVVVSGHVTPSGGLVADAIRPEAGLAPDAGGPTPLRAPSGLLPGLGGETLKTPGLGLPTQPGGFAPSLPNLGAPGGLAPAPNISIPGGLPGLRR